MTYSTATCARDFALQLLAATDLPGKAALPARGLSLLDEEAPCIIEAPQRPIALRIASSRDVHVPPMQGMKDPLQRARILNALANHELQAAELFAFALLAFPQAPIAFRNGLLKLLADEQRHMMMYVERMRALGHEFGDFAVTGHFWSKLDHMRTPLSFVCTMGMTFENANLDFATDYANAARAVGDLETAKVLQQVHDDEIGHVRFGWVWMKKLAPGADPWATFSATLMKPLSPARARGKIFDEDARRRAGLSAEFVAALAATSPVRPSGAPR